MQNLTYNEHTSQTQIFQGNCLDILPELKDCSVDLIVTSPPYADQRKDTYGGVHLDNYVEWFLPNNSHVQSGLCTIGLDSHEKGTIFLREGIESERQLNRAA